MSHGKLSERELPRGSLCVLSSLTLPSRLTEDYNLELQYRKPFLEVWEDEKNDRELGPLSERMGVRDRATGALMMTEEEKDAASEYSFANASFRKIQLR